jgi:hypothetical protein
MANLKIRFCSNALISIGADPINSFEDGTAEATVASNLYEQSIDFLLCVHPWRFAITKRELSLLSTKPRNEWQYAYQLPKDFLQIESLPVETDNYEIYADKLFIDTNDILIVDMWYRVPEEKFPPWFVPVVESYLAMKFAMPVTEDVNMYEGSKTEYADHLRQARKINAMQRPTQRIGGRRNHHDPFPLTSVRTK